MPRTRIRQKNRLTVNTGGSQVGDSGNPAGSSLTTDDLGFIDITLAELNDTPAEAASFALAASSAEVSALPADVMDFLVIMLAPTDPVNTPAGANAAELRAGGSTAAQTTSVGTGWTNTANAAGLNNGTNSTINSAAGLGAANTQGTLVISFADIGAFASNATLSGTVTLTIYAALTVGLLATGSLTVAYATDGGTVYTQVASVTATNAGPFTVTIPSATLTNLANLKVRLVASVTGSATGASTATADAAVVSFATTGNNAG